MPFVRGCKVTRRSYAKSAGMRNGAQVGAFAKYQYTLKTATQRMRNMWKETSYVARSDFADASWIGRRKATS